MTSYRITVFSLLVVLTVLAVQEGAATAYASTGGGVSTIQPPPAAAAAGYTRLVFQEEFNDTSGIDVNDTGQPGFNFYRRLPFRNRTLPLDRFSVNDGVLTISSISGPGFGLVSVAGIGNNQWVGFTAANGAYFEASIAFDPTVRSKSHPAFWSMAAEKLYGGDHDGYMETDFMEYNMWRYGVDNAYGGAIHWWGVHPVQLQNNYDNQVIYVSKDTDWKQFHTFGTLWIPGQTIDYYFDNERKSTNPFSKYNLFKGGDSQHWPVILGSDDWPMRVDWVRVWQK